MTGFNLHLPQVRQEETVYATQFIFRWIYLENVDTAIKVVENSFH